MPPISMPIGKYCKAPCLSSAKSTSSIITTNRNSTADRADIDHDQDHRQEFGAQHHEQPGGVDEGEDQVSTECTGFFAAITMKALATHRPANR